MLYRFFTSVRLTIVLLLLLASTAVVGTLWPSVEDMQLLPPMIRFLRELMQFSPAEVGQSFHATPWFRILLLLLALNLAACSWKTLRRNLDDRERFSALLKKGGGTARIDCSCSAEELHTDLKAAGFRVRSVEGGVIATRGRLGRWGSTIVHLSLLIILLGGILSELGFVGTLTLPVGESNSTYFDWDYEVDLPLGFTVQLDDFQIIYYPIDVRFGLYDPQTHELLADIITREGETVALPLDGLSARVVRFVPFDQTLYLDLLHHGEKVGSYRTPSSKAKENPDNALDSELLIRLTGFKDPIDKQYQSRVTILEQGEVVKTGVIEVNRPLVHRGVAIFQTAYNQDEFGFWYSGFQLSRDPGEPLVWGGAILLMVGLCCAFGIRYRVVAVVVAEAGVALHPLTGFGDERGEQLLSALQRQSGEEEVSRQTPG